MSEIGSDETQPLRTSVELVTFDAVEAARNPEMQTALLEMAYEDGSKAALEHALKVIAAANSKNSTDSQC